MNCRECRVEIIKDNQQFITNKVGIFICKTCKLCYSKKLSKGNKGRINGPHSKETIEKISKSKKGNIPWNKNISPSKKTREKQSKAHKGKIISKKTREKQSKKNKLNWQNEEYRKNVRDGTRKNLKYKNIKFQSSWEIKVAKWLDDNNILWEYESNKCVYSLNNGRNYIIDFYLPELNKYIEVKNWWDEYSSYKYIQASKKLDMCIIDKRNIDNINLDLKMIKVLI